MTVLVLPENNYEFNTHPQNVDYFISLNRKDLKLTEINGFWGSGSFPNDLVFIWRSENEESIFEISERADFKESVVKKTSKQGLILTNFKTGTTYYWRVNNSEPRCFTTKSGVRLIKIDGEAHPDYPKNPNSVVNIRDIGGYTVGNKKVIQGLIYRGTAFDYMSKCIISEKGKNTFLNELCIKTEIDLRESGTTLYEEGIFKESGISFYNGDISHYYVDLLNKYKSNIKILFENYFADKSKYPIYLHCQGGIDRTGCIIALLLGMLGVSKEDVITDYELSTLAGLYISGASRNDDEKSKPFWEEINRYDGNTFGDKILSYLKSCGITDSTINEVKSNLLTDLV